MTDNEKTEILEKAKNFFETVIVENHLKNTKKLGKLKKFNVNPFLVKYLSNFIGGSDDAENIAKVLIYPRVLGTSINTSFGSNLQKFCTTILSGYASTTSGIDIEFNDQVDNEKKYCQIKAGPNTINYDDVETIRNHFRAVKRLARTNNLKITDNQLIVGVLYGTNSELSGNYKLINEEYPVIVGKEFWHRLTGDENFYFSLIDAIASTAITSDVRASMEQAIHELANEIRTNASFFNQD